MLEMYELGDMNPAGLSIKEDLSSDNNDFEELPEIWGKVIAGESTTFEWNAKKPSNNSVFEVEVYLTRIALHHHDVILATIRDISEKKKAERMIQYLSFHDQLTGLYNRAFFEKELIRLDIARSLPISIIMADVNGLKLANDAFGHLAGDELLKLAGDVFRKGCRQEDIVARWGGDEFVVILTKTDYETASRVCERIKDECTKAEMKPILLSIGLGYATKVNEKQSIFETIKEAETLMYANKLKEGRVNRQKIIYSLLAKRAEWDHNNELMMKLCSQLANVYGLKDNQCEEIKLLAYIHDIGKVSIPLEIITKPSSLSEDEWEVIKKHSEIGYRIASTYPEYAHLAESVLTHHERWDGKGYPRKLKEEEIPIYARILCIVDAYDAMTSGRPYREALSSKEALREIEINGGYQFDPELTKLFINLMRDEI